MNFATVTRKTDPTRCVPQKSIVQRQCPICRRVRCPLKSHQTFARHLADKQRQQQQQWHNAPLRQIDNEKADPFANHPIHMTPDLERFYAQGWLRWNSDFKGPERHLFPRSRFGAVFKAAWHDVALHYGLLSVIATQISILRDGTVDEPALELQLKAIAAQRQALLKGELCDARVMTALCIMSNAFAANSKEHLSAHLQLISVWLQRRGGLAGLGMEGIIADNLMYADHTKAVIYNVLPSYHSHLPAISSTTAPKAGLAYVQLQVRGLISEELVMTADSYVVLVRIFDRAAKGRCTPSEQTYFAYLATIVEYQLACANAKLHDTNTLEECLVLACLVANHSLLRNYGQLAPSMPLLELRLWRCFDDLRQKDFFTLHRLHDLECFLACIGSITSVRRPSPFEDRTVKIIMQLRSKSPAPFREFYQLCDIMESYGWSESVCLTLYARLWNKSSESDLTLEERQD